MKNHAESGLVKYFTYDEEGQDDKVIYEEIFLNDLKQPLLECPCKAVTFFIYNQRGEQVGVRPIPFRKIESFSRGGAATEKTVNFRSESDRHKVPPTPVSSCLGLQQNKELLRSPSFSASPLCSVTQTRCPKPVTLQRSRDPLLTCFLSGPSSSPGRRFAKYLAYVSSDNRIVAPPAPPAKRGAGKPCSHLMRHCSEAETDGDDISLSERSSLCKLDNCANRSSSSCRGRSSSKESVLPSTSADDTRPSAVAAARYLTQHAENGAVNPRIHLGANACYCSTATASTIEGTVLCIVPRYPQNKGGNERIKYYSRSLAECLVQCYFTSVSDVQVRCCKDVADFVRRQLQENRLRSINIVGNQNLDDMSRTQVALAFSSAELSLLVRHANLCFLQTLADIYDIKTSEILLFLLEGDAKCEI